MRIVQPTISYSMDALCKSLKKLDAIALHAYLTTVAKE
jgi:hypothetical protein